MHIENHTGRRWGDWPETLITILLAVGLLTILWFATSEKRDAVFCEDLRAKLEDVRSTGATPEPKQWEVVMCEQEGVEL